MRPHKLLSFLALLLASALPFALRAQTATARVTGTVTDASGAALVNAAVMAHNNDTGEDRTVNTDGSGAFTFFSLHPNSYNLRADAAGFTAVSLQNLKLFVSQEYVWTPKLPMSSAAAEVTVSADDSSQLDTSSARIGGVVTPREIAALPINGRQISQLYLLTPGATNTGAGDFDNIHFSGRAVEQNIIRLDGIEATSIIDTSPGNLNGELTSIFRLQQSLEAVQEFRVDSTAYPAEMGTGTGGQISFVTKSGTNKLHGSTFEYIRNDIFDARPYFNRASNAVSTTKFRLNQFGGSVGGSLLHDKLFGFAAYEGLRQIYSQPYTQATLSNYFRTNASGTLPLNAAILPLLAAFPVDPTPAAQESSNTATVTSIGQNRIQEDFGIIRFDYRFNDKYSAYVRYNRDQGVAMLYQDASLSRFGQVEVPQNGVLAFNQVLSSRFFNETKFGFNGIKMRVQGFAGPSPNADLSSSRISVAGVTNVGALISLSSSFNGTGAPYTGQSYSYIDNFSAIFGKHNTKFGVEIRPLGLYNDQIGGTTYTYNSVQNFANNATDQIQFYGNLSDKSPFTGLSGNAYVKQAYYIGYAEDEWKIAPNITLNYGLRYEYYSPLHETRNKNVVFNMATGTITPGATGDWYYSSPKNLGPRVGLTYAPAALNGKTVLRVGGGIYYGPGQTEDQIQPEANDRVTKTFGTFASTGKTYPIIPASDVYATYDINNPNLGYQPRAYAPNYSIPERIGSFTLSVEQQLPGKFQLMVGYVGAEGRNLFLRSVTNRITGLYENPVTGAGTAIREFTAGGTATTFNPATGAIVTAGAPGTNRFAEIDYKTSHGSDSYNALQTAVTHRYNSGLNVGAQYTYAKELGTSSGSNEATTSGNNYDLSTEFGRGLFDIRHYANVTALYDLPFGHGKAHSFGGVTDALLGGFQVGGILNARSGLPIDVLITRPDLAYVGNPGTAVAGQVFSSPVVTGGVVQTTAVVNVPGGGNTRNIRRPNVVPGVDPYLRTKTITNAATGAFVYQYLNPAAFSVPAPGTYGNARRNGYNGPSLVQLDMTLGKAIPITERLHLELKAEIFNILNHPNFANPGTVRLTQGLPAAPGAANTIQPGTPFPNLAVAGSAFGVYSSTVSQQTGIGNNRQIQLSGRISF